jgi:heptosyltransferase-2
LGDAVMLTAFLAALRDRYPRAHLVAVTGKLGVEILAATGLMNEVWARGSTRDMRRRLRRERFDLAIMGYPQNKWLLTAALAGVKVRIGPDEGKYRWLLHARIPWEKGDHEVLFPLGKILTALGGKPLDYTPHLTLRPEDQAAADKVWQSVKAPAVALMTGASHPAKAWPIERFQALAQALQAQGHAVINLGGPSEAGAIPGAIETAGVLSPLATAAFLTKCQAVVTNDTGVAHLATAVKCPVVALYGPTRELILPLSDPLAVRLCGACDCPRPLTNEGCRQTCLPMIETSQVQAELHRLLATRAEPR